MTQNCSPTLSRASTSQSDKHQNITVYMYVHVYIYRKVPSECPHLCNRHPPPPNFAYRQHALCGSATIRHYHVSPQFVLVLRKGGALMVLYYKAVNLWGVAVGRGGGSYVQYRSDASYNACSYFTYLPAEVYTQSYMYVHVFVSMLTH